MVALIVSYVFAIISGVMVGCERYGLAVFFVLISISTSSLAAAVFIVDHLSLPPVLERGVGYFLSFLDSYLLLLYSFFTPPSRKSKTFSFVSTILT
jgi:hypothetical protein